MITSCHGRQIDFSPIAKIEVGWGELDWGGRGEFLVVNFGSRKMLAQALSFIHENGNMSPDPKMMVFLK